MRKTLNCLKCVQIIIVLSFFNLQVMAESIFGKTQFYGGPAEKIEKWNRILKLTKKTACLGCSDKQWQLFIESLVGLPKLEQIIEVNTHFNNIKYIEDSQNYGVEDYWATPKQFLSRGGDCEDYAIAKYFALRQLGFSNDVLKIILLEHLKLGINHVVLAVRLNQKTYILDNLFSNVKVDKRIRHYRPHLSFHSKSWWYFPGSL